MRSSVNWLLITFMFAFPFSMGLGLIFAAFKLRRKWVRISAAIVGTIFLVAFAFAAISFAPYVWASHLEAKWQPANPKTKAELESYLSLYTKRDIQPSQSEWGNQYQLQPGEQMTQYLLLWNAPLDVVYTSNNTVVAIYTSYE
jgi:hypothetical protein